MTRVLIIYVNREDLHPNISSFVVDVTDEDIHHLQLCHDDAFKDGDYTSWYYVVHRLGLMDYKTEDEFEEIKESTCARGDISGLKWEDHNIWKQTSSQEIDGATRFFLIDEEDEV
jgi:hypothetical protein